MDNPSSQTTDTHEDTSPFTPEGDEHVLRVEDFGAFLDYFRKCIRRHQGSVLFECKTAGRELYAKGDWDKFEETRNKHKHNRTFLTDQIYIYVKETPSNMRSRCSATLQAIMSTATCGQLLPPDGHEEFEKIVPCGDGKLDLGRFMGEPDGSLAWFGEIVPFMIIETCYSDSGAKACNRARHWVVRGGGQLTFAFSLKIEVTNNTLTVADVHLYRWSTAPPIRLITQNAMHGKCVPVTSIAHSFCLQC